MSRRKESDSFDVFFVIFLLFAGIYYVIKWIFKGIGWLLKKIIILLFHVKKEKEIKKLEEDISVLNSIGSNELMERDSMLSTLHKRTFRIAGINNFSESSILWLYKMIKDNDRLYIQSNVCIDKIEIQEIILNMYNDIRVLYNENKLDFNDEIFYKNEFNKYFDTYIKIIEKLLKLYKLRNNNDTSFSYNEAIETIYGSMSFLTNFRLESLKDNYNEYSFYKTINVQTFISDRPSNYHMNDFIYMVHTFVTCICISKLFFCEYYINNIDEESEFNKVTMNMLNNINDLTIIKEKLKPLCKKKYQDVLVGLNDDFSLNMVIDVLFSKYKESKRDNNIIFEKKVETCNEYNVEIMKVLDAKAKELKKIKVCDIICNSIQNNLVVDDLVVYIEILKKMEEYEKYYDCQLDNYNIEYDKERYLMCDFSREQEIIDSRYSLNNITTGDQFEIYLVNLFKALKYKSKRVGKTGDQGADLILKKDDYVYVVQAKYYTGKLSNTPIQEVVGAIKFYNANQGVVVTNSTFTAAAKELAKSNNVILIDGKGLKKLVDYMFTDEEDVLQKM